MYLSIISIAAFGTLITTVSETMRQPKYRAFKGALFAMMGIGSAIPVIHIEYLSSFPGSDILSAKSSMVWYLVMGFFYLGGLVIYIT